MTHIDNWPHSFATSYSLCIDLNSIGSNGWPRVYEIGGRHQATSIKHNVDAIYLHFYPDESCCLGIRFSPERFLTIERLMDELVIPFLYRLSYVDKKGLTAAKKTFGVSTLMVMTGSGNIRTRCLAWLVETQGRNELCPCGKRSQIQEMPS